MAEERKFPLHIRSAFIQGLVMMQPEEVPPFLRDRAAPVLQKVDAICREAGLTRVQLALGFVKRQQAITRLVFGVRDLAQLKEDIAVFSKDLPAGVIAELETRFSNVETDIVVPSLWKK